MKASNQDEHSKSVRSLGSPRRNLSRRGFLALAASGLATGAMAASPAQSAASAAPAARTAKPFAGKTVNALCMTSPIADFYPKLASDFEATTGAKVNFDILAVDAYNQKVAVELSAKSDAYDVAYCEGGQFARWVKGNWVIPIDSYLEQNKAALDWSDFLDGSAKDVQYEGKTYGLPVFAATQIFYYRKDVLEKFGYKNPPDTWDDVLAYAKKIHTQDVAAFAMRGRPGNSLNMWSFPVLVYAFGGDFVKKYPSDMHPTVDSEAWIKAAEFYADLLQNYSVPGGANINYDDIVVAYQQGRVAMAIEGAPLAGLIFDPQKSRVIGKSGFAIHPKGPAGRFAPQTTHSLMITAGSKQKDLAWELILFLASRDMQFKNAIDGKGTSVTRISVIESDAYKNKYNWEGGAFGRVYRENLKYAPAPYRPFTPEWPEVGDRLGVALSQVLSKQKTARQAFSEAQKDVFEIYRKAGYYRS